MADTDDAKSKADERFNNIVALSIALLATFIALSSIKSGNVAQAIEQAQVESNDSWAWYQAVRVREDMATYELQHLQRLARNEPPGSAEAARLAPEIAAQEAELTHIRERKDEVQGKAKAADARNAQLNVFDDQYDLSNALISISLALLAVCVLSKTRWLYWFSLIPATLGVAAGAAAMAGLPFQLERVFSWLL